MANDRDPLNSHQPGQLLNREENKVEPWHTSVVFSQSSLSPLIHLCSNRAQCQATKWPGCYTAPLPRNHVTSSALQQSLTQVILAVCLERMCGRERMRESKRERDGEKRESERDMERGRERGKERESERAGNVRFFGTPSSPSSRSTKLNSSCQAGRIMCHLQKPFAYCW